jgi:hypothetical protein
MKTIHIKSIVQPKSYGTPMQAHYGAEQENKAILNGLPFDIITVLLQNGQGC